MFTNFERPPVRATQHRDELMSSIAKMFDCPEYSDATILIQGVTLHVHQLVLCIQSEYFAHAFLKFAEGTRRTIEFNEGSGAAHWRVFEYLYTGDYSDHISNTQLTDDPDLLKDARVYALADMFFIEGLKSLSSKRLQARLQQPTTSTAFVECVQEVYTLSYENDRCLRSVVVQAALHHKHDQDMAAGLEQLFRDGGDFAVDYLHALDKQFK